MAEEEAGAASPEGVLALRGPPEGFLCGVEANRFGVEFLDFAIRNADDGKVVFQISRGDGPQIDPRAAQDDPDALRSIDYAFPAEFLAYRSVGTTLKFRVGPQPVRNLRMVEHHHYKGELIRSFDFSFPFCAPDSENEWDAQYVLDEPLAPEVIADMVANPFSVTSDSYYFVDGQLIMHNKARYRYTDGDSA